MCHCFPQLKPVNKGAEERHCTSLQITGSFLSKPNLIPKEQYSQVTIFSMTACGGFAYRMWLFSKTKSPSNLTASLHWNLFPHICSISVFHSTDGLWVYMFLTAFRFAAVSNTGGLGGSNGSSDHCCPNVIPAPCLRNVSKAFARLGLWLVDDFHFESAAARGTAKLQGS